jgi:hypothetical protein
MSNVTRSVLKRILMGPKTDWRLGCSLKIVENYRAPSLRSGC